MNTRTTNTRPNLAPEMEHATYIFRWTDSGVPPLTPDEARELVAACRAARHPARHQQFRILRVAFLFMAAAAAAGWALYIGTFPVRGL